MKKTIITLVLALTCLFATAQNHLTEGRRPFAYIGTGSAPSSPTILSGLSGEIGFWGTTKVTSYSLTLDITDYNLSKAETWVGVKPYFTAFDNGKISYMLYFQPKFNTNNFNTRVIELGFNPNYTLNNNMLLGLTVGGQLDKSNEFSPFLGVGLVLLK